MINKLFPRIYRTLIYSPFVWPIYQRIFMPWPPRGWTYTRERVTTKDGRVLEIKHPIPPLD